MVESATSAAIEDRTRLEAFVDRYLAALAANDPSSLPVTDGLVFSENDQLLTLGQGCWATVTGLGSYRHLFADTNGDRVGFIGTVRENGVPAIYDLCLQLDGERIAQIESLIIRDAFGATRLEQMDGPEPVWLEPVPAAQRLTRQELAATAGRYLAGMENNDGTGDYSFFHRECNRIEHGLQTTNVKTGAAYGHSHDTDFASLSAEEQWKTGFLGFVTEIRERRILVVDEQRQVVLLAATLDHNGTVREIPMTTGKTFVIPPYFDVPRTLQVMEAFRVRDGKLYRIEMTLTEVPYGTRAPVARADERRLVDGRDEPTAGAGRAGGAAAQVLGQVLEALRRHDASALPLAPDVRYTENGQHLAIGDGLWRTLSAYADGPAGSSQISPPAYRIELAQQDGSQAAWFGGIVEHTTAGMLMLRVRLADAQITEIEAVAVRLEEAGERSGTVTLFQPRSLTPIDPSLFNGPDSALAQPGPALDRETATAIVEQYFDGIERDDSTNVPLEEQCSSRVNGHRTSNDPDASALDPDLAEYRPFALSVAELIDSGFFARVDRVRDRRHVVDEARGLVLSIAAVDAPGRIKAVDVPGVGRAQLPGMPSANSNEEHSEDELFASARSANLVVPVSELVVQLTKIQHGRITRLESLSRGGPFGLRTGWA